MLRQRQEEEERIEAERRKRVIVTIDLLGRKVLRRCHYPVVILLLGLFRLSPFITMQVFVSSSVVMWERSHVIAEKFTVAVQKCSF